MTGRHVTELINLSSNTRQLTLNDVGFTNDAILGRSKWKNWLMNKMNVILKNLLKLQEGPADCIRIGEVVAALKKMKKHKAPGLWGLSAEIIQATEGIGTQSQIYVMVLRKKVAFQRIGSQVWYYPFTKGKVIQCSVNLIGEVNGNWTTRGYANSPIANSRTGQLAVAANRSICCFNCMIRLCGLVLWIDRSLKSISGCEIGRTIIVKFSCRRRPFAFRPRLRNVSSALSLHLSLSVSLSVRLFDPCMQRWVR